MLDVKEKMERKKRLEEAIAINAIEGVEPTEFAKAIYEKYINGELEIENAIGELIEKYKED